MDRKSYNIKLMLPIAYFFTLSAGVIFTSGYLLLNSKGLTTTLAKEEENLIAENIVIDITKNIQTELVVDESNVTDIRVAKIDAYFGKFKSSKNGLKSPLAGMGDIFVREADKNQLDWRLLPAIALHESAAGTSLTAGGTNNIFGWGFNDDPSTNNAAVNQHDSIEHSIKVVAQKIRQSYYDKGLVEVDEIVTKYNPGSVVRAGGIPKESTWTKTINLVMEQINNQEVE